MLIRHAEDLWTLDYPARALGMPLGIRMTVVRLKDGGLWLHSPVPVSDDDQRALEAIGPVRYVVAPNKFHHLHARAAKARFPQAKLVGAPGLPEKRKRLVFDGVLGNTPDPGYATDLEQHVIGGMPLVNEVVFYHAASRTLIVTDLLFHFRSAASAWMWLYLTLTAQVGVPSQTRLFRAAIKDKAAYGDSMSVLRCWDFDRILLAHGEIVATGGKAAFDRALAWLR